MSAEPATLKDRRILVIEDDYIVAMVLVELLEDAGAKILGPIGWIEEAIAFVESSSDQFDVAILDVNLHGKKSFPIADALAARQKGFAFSTGYDAGVLEDKYRFYPRCEKPFNQSMLIAALNSA